jgi:hypothetical protein
MKEFWIAMRDKWIERIHVCREAGDLLGAAKALVEVLECQLELDGVTD